MEPKQTPEVDNKTGNTHKIMDESIYVIFHDRENGTGKLKSVMLTAGMKMGVATRLINRSDRSIGIEFNREELEQVKDQIENALKRWDADNTKFKV